MEAHIRAELTDPLHRTPRSTSAPAMLRSRQTLDISALWYVASGCRRVSPLLISTVGTGSFSVVLRQSNHAFISAQRLVRFLDPRPRSELADQSGSATQRGRSTSRSLLCSLPVAPALHILGTMDMPNQPPISASLQRLSEPATPASTGSSSASRRCCCDSVRLRPL